MTRDGSSGTAVVREIKIARQNIARNGVCSICGAEMEYTDEPGLLQLNHRDGCALAANVDEETR